jgi:hypothetical protein
MGFTVSLEGLAQALALTVWNSVCVILPSWRSDRGGNTMITICQRGALALSFFVCVVLMAQSADATPIAHLTLESEPGDFIGQGLDFDVIYTPSNSSFFSPQIRRTIGPTADPAELLFVLGTVTGGADNTFALLFFGTDALGIPIGPGFFLDAERADFASPGHPGLDISFQNRGCNTVAGSFTIHAVSFSDRAETATGSSIETFSASFEQHCEGAAPALRGTFTYNAFGIPEPATFMLLFWLVPFALFGRRWRH